MKYYATVYTGSLTPGEYLTEEQVANYGEEKIASLIARGALRAVDDTPGSGAEQRDESNRSATGASALGSGSDVTEGTVPQFRSPKAAKPAEPEGDDGEEAEEEDIGLPELTADEVAGEAPAEKPKKGGRRKTK